MKIEIITTRIYPHNMDYEFNWVKNINVLDAVLIKEKEWVEMVIIKILEK